MKSNLDKFFKTNETLEKEGVWFEIADGVQFLCRAFKPGNPKAKAAMAQEYKPYAKQIEMETLSDNRLREIQTKMFVEASLVDWKGVIIDGKETPYSKEVAVQFLLGLPLLADTLWKQCTDYTNYKDDVGNSSADT